MTFQYEVTRADVALVQSLAVKRCQSEVGKALSLRTLGGALSVAVGLLFALVIVLIRKYADGPLAPDLVWLLGLALAVVGLLLVYWRAYRKRYAAWREAELAPFPIPQQLVVASEGLVFEGRFGRVHYPWNTIRS